MDTLHPRPPYLPLAIPQDLAPRIMRLHGHPAVWWIGQFVKYLLRPQPVLQKEMDFYYEKLKFQKPIVGCVFQKIWKCQCYAFFFKF